MTQGQNSGVIVAKTLVCGLYCLILTIFLQSTIASLSIDSYLVFICTLGLLLILTDSNILLVHSAYIFSLALL